MSQRPAALRPRDNPFASRRVDGLSYRIREGDMDDLLAGLSRRGRRGAIVGPHGSGKTTLLEHLAGRLEGERVWIRLNADLARPMATVRSSLPPAVDRRHTILVDGAEQLGRPAWWWFQRRVKEAGCLVITSHRPGRLPTIHECRTDPWLLGDLVRELAPEAADRVDLDELFHRHRGNIRLCFRELYDRFAER